MMKKSNKNYTNFDSYEFAETRRYPYPVSATRVFYHAESFRYLGRYFDFNMSDERHKSELLDTFTDTLNRINELPLHPKNKIILYTRYVLAKISWHLTVTDIGKTWVNEKLDSVASNFIRKWLELPISTTLSNVQLPHNKFGLNIILYLQQNPFSPKQYLGKPCSYPQMMK